MAELVAPKVDASFQYASHPHQADTAIAGMWLFLASEILFFGGLIFVWVVLRQTHAQEMRQASAHTNLLIGSVNTALLLTSSLACTRAVALAGRGDCRAAAKALACTGAIGVVFVGLKLREWGIDLDEHLFPGSSFAMDGAAPGATQLFFAWYFVATGLHVAHMLVGLGLLAWVGRLAWRGAFAPGHATAVEVVALYWSFVDLVWIVLFALIYVVGRT